MPTLNTKRDTRAYRLVTAEILTLSAPNKCRFDNSILANSHLVRNNFDGWELATLLNVRIDFDV